MKDKKDLRIVKTEQALFNALTKLIKDKSFEEIKVADICNEALINRTTFYAHYSDKYELLLALIKDLKNNLQTVLNQNSKIVNNAFFINPPFLQNFHLSHYHYNTYNYILKTYSSTD